MTRTPRIASAHRAGLNVPQSGVCIALGLLSFLGIQPVSAQLSSQDEAALRTVSSSALTSLSSGNVETFVALFHEDVILQPPNASSIRGLDELRTWARAFSPVVSLTWPNARWHGDGDLAYLTTDYRLQLGDLPPDEGKQLGVYRRGAGGKWQIAAVSFNSDLPVPQRAVASHQAAVATLVSVENSKEYERLNAVLAPDFRREGPDQDSESLAEWKAYLRQIQATYPDFHIDLTESVFEGDRHFCRWTATGSVPSSGKTFELSGMSMHRFEDGMMTEEKAYFDTASIQAQLEVETVPHTR